MLFEKKKSNSQYDNEVLLKSQILSSYVLQIFARVCVRLLIYVTKKHFQFSFEKTFLMKLLLLNTELQESKQTSRSRDFVRIFSIVYYM